MRVIKKNGVMKYEVKSKTETTGNRKAEETRNTKVAGVGEKKTGARSEKKATGENEAATGEKKAATGEKKQQQEKRKQQ